MYAECIKYTNAITLVHFANLTLGSSTNCPVTTIGGFSIYKQLTAEYIV